MAANLNVPVQAQDPPQQLVKRRVQVGLGVTNTVRIPHDRFHDRKSAWYSAGNNMPQPLDGNQAQYLLQGEGTFPEMVAAMRTAKAPGHFIYFINWFCDVDFEMLPGQSDTKLKELLRRASNDHVMVRGSFWTVSISQQNVNAIAFFNGLEWKLTAQGPSWTPIEPPFFDSAAVSDRRGDESIPVLKDIPVFGLLGRAIPKHFGSQHQKILCVNGEQGLICFCGGVDINPNRIPDPNGKVEDGSPLHDVHCRIVGPAAWDLVNLFVQKWNDHPDGKKINAHRPLIVPPKPPANGDQTVQITRTYLPGQFSFAKDGETSSAEMIMHAIRNAKRFIYTECQYFVGSPALESALLNAIPHIEHLTVLLTHWELITDTPYINAHRKPFLAKLQDAGGDKVRIFALQPGGNNNIEFQKGKVFRTYVHAKIWFIDDEFASIGTVNSNRRSWYHDAEVSAAVYETSTDRVLRYRFAHLARIAVWKQHLGMDPATADAELADGVASAVHWLKRSPDARVAPYDVNQTDRNGNNDSKPWWGRLAAWDRVVDPS